MKIIEACDVIRKAKGNAILVSTMRAMYAFDKLGVGQPRLSAVPLMGGASSLGLGLSLAHPSERVIVVDGDASLLMQLGSLVTVSGQQPTNFHHFVIFNGTQFTGISNLPLPGDGRFDLGALASAAGYRSVHRFDELVTFEQQIEKILSSPGPVFVVLDVEPDAPAYPAKPWKDFADFHFSRMGEEAVAVRDRFLQGQAQP